MREDGLEDVMREQRRRTMISEPTAPRPPDLVNRHFSASRPYHLWAPPTSPIFAPCRAGSPSPSSVYSRMIVGW